MKLIALLIMIITFSIIGCKIKRKENICEKELLLLNPNNELKTLKINLNKLNDSVLKENGFILNCASPKKHEFNVIVNNLKIKAYITRNCCQCIRKDIPSISIFPNNKGKALISSEVDTIIEFKEIPKWFKDNYLVKNQENKVFKQIGIGWNKDITTENLNSVIQNIINGYLISANKIANNKYKKEICELETKELNLIMEYLPFELRLINFNSDERIKFVKPIK